MSIEERKELLSKFKENVQESIKILKDSFEQLGEDFNEFKTEMKSKFKELTDFLTFNNKRYRRFINKNKF